jgi:hypothetical protein
MNNASLELGGTNWAEKDGNILGYSVGDTSGKYSPQEFTFARGSNLSATRIDRAGLIVKGRENLALQSNQFDTTWVNINSNETSGQSGYDGSNDAWILSKSASGGFIYQIANSYSGVYTFSVYAKANASNFIRLNGNAVTDADAFFNLSTGLVQSSINCIDVKIESVGNGWYRCSITSNDSDLDYINIYPAEAGSISGNSGSVYIQDAQLEQGLAASPYIESGATNGTAGVLENTPRLNYTTGVANPYLLLEPSRTNLFSQSEYFGDWTTFRSSVSANQATSPEGLTNAYKLIQESGQTSSGGLFKGVTTIDATTYTYTFFAKEAGYGWCFARLMGGGNNYYAWFDLSNGIKGNVTNGATSAIEPYGNDWYRCSITFANLGTSAVPHIYIAEANSSAAVSNPDGVKGINIYGAQIELGTYPTSYIPTYSVSATRAVDVCNKLDASGEIGQTEGTVFFEWDYQNVGSSGGNIVVSLAGTHLQEIYFWVQGNGNYIYDVYNSSQQVNISGSMGSFGIKKIALAYKNNDFALYINGVLAGTDTSGSVPTLDRLYIGGYALNTNYNISSGINQVLLYKERLTNAELATLTTI